MRRLPRSSVPVVLSVLFVVACSGGATPGPAETPTGAPPTAAPTDAPTADPGPTDDNGGFPPGVLPNEWTSGSVEVRLRDGYDADFTLDLSPGSFLAAGTAYLAYGDGDPWVVQVVLEGETGDGFVLTGPVVSGGGTDDGNCVFDIRRKDDSGIDARIECTDTGGFEGATIHEGLDVTLTVKASR